MGLTRAPKYVHGFIDQHGKPRFYLRRRGFKKVPLPGLPWSPEFMAAYEAAFAGQAHPQIAASKIIPGSMRALAVSYFQSLEFCAMKPNSQSVRRNIVDRFCREHGDKRAATLQRQHIIGFMVARAEKPESANGLLKALRALMKRAVEIGLRADDPTRDIKAIRTHSDGYHSWTDDEIAQFEGRHPVGSRARLAFALLLYTGQRRSDVVRMGRQRMRDGFLHIRQLKTGAELSIPCIRLIKLRSTT